MATYEVIGFAPDGIQLGGASTSLVSLYGKTPIAQQTSPTLATTTQPAASGSTFVASIQSIAVNAATAINAVIQDLIDFGIYA